MAKTISDISSGSPLPALLLLLSFSTGILDAASIIGLAKVFVANMTGNIVFLGFGLAQVQGFSVGPNLVALLAFLLGALIAGRIGRAFGGGPLRRWLSLCALCETSLLWASAGVALCYSPTDLSPHWALYAIIVLTAVAMGFRNATIRQLKVPDLTTTVLTLTLTGIAADARVAGGTAPNLVRRWAAVLAILLGAAIGAMMVMHFGLAVPLFVAGALGLAGTLACARHPSAGLARPT